MVRSWELRCDYRVPFAVSWTVSDSSVIRVEALDPASAEVRGLEIGIARVYPMVLPDEFIEIGVVP